MKDWRRGLYSVRSTRFAKRAQFFPEKGCCLAFSVIKIVQGTGIKIHFISTECQYTSTFVSIRYYDTGKLYNFCVDHTPGLSNISTHKIS